MTYCQYETAFHAKHGPTTVRYFDVDRWIRSGTPRLFQTEPSGAYHEWMANATGRGQKSVREYLEEHYNDTSVKDEAGTLRLAIKALSEVVQSGASNIEIACITRKQDANTKKYSHTVRTLPLNQIEQLLKDVESEKSAEAEEKKKKSKASYS